jgi:FdhE protein
MVTRPRLVADPGEIGNIPEAPFVVPPDPLILFGTRARRLETLAGSNPFGAFLRFMAVVAHGQDAVLAQLPPVRPPAAPDGNGPAAPPPLDRSSILAERHWPHALRILAGQVAAATMPAEAAMALGSLMARSSDEVRAFSGRVLDRRFTPEEGPEALFLVAALQAVWTRRAAAIPANAIASREAPACPVCGATPVASLVCAGGDRQGLRFLVCSLCASQWRHVRIKCTVCGGTKGIAYHGIAGQDGPAKAETCPECRAYTKIIYAEKDPESEPVADDLGSLALDVLMSDAGWRRAYPNPFLSPGLHP